MTNTDKLYETLLDVYVDDALNTAVTHLQNQLLINDGDFASHFFSGDKGTIIKDILKQYINEQLTFTNRC